MKDIRSGLVIACLAGMSACSTNSRRGHGVVSEHPALVDINGDRVPRTVTDEALERLRALGYVLRGSPAPDQQADLFHTNLTLGV